MNENKIVEVCGSCLRASCWYGEFMCDEAINSRTILKTIKELLPLKLEHKENWSDKKMIKIYGESAPSGYANIT